MTSSFLSIEADGLELEMSNGLDSFSFHTPSEVQNLQVPLLAQTWDNRLEGYPQHHSFSNHGNYALPPAYVYHDTSAMTQSTNDNDDGGLKAYLSGASSFSPIISQMSYPHAPLHYLRPGAAGTDSYMMDSARVPPASVASPSAYPYSRKESNRPKVDFMYGL